MNNTIKKIAAFAFAFIPAAAIYSAMIAPFNASASSVMRGDVNNDNQITVTDIALVASHIKGINALDSDETTRADVNRDKKIDVSDIAIIASHIKGIKAIGDNSNNGTTTPEPTTTTEPPIVTEPPRTGGWEPQDTTPAFDPWHRLYGDPLGWGFEYWYWWNEVTGEICVGDWHP